MSSMTLCEGSEFNRILKLASHHLLLTESFDLDDDDNIITNIVWTSTPFTSDYYCHDGAANKYLYIRLAGTIIELYTDVDTVFLHHDSQKMFNYFRALERIDFLKSKISLPTDGQSVEVEKMFNYCTALTELDLSNLDFTYADGDTWTDNSPLQIVKTPKNLHESMMYMRNDMFPDYNDDGVPDIFERYSPLPPQEGSTSTTFIADKVAEVYVYEKLAFSQIPFTKIKEISKWSNYTKTLKNFQIPSSLFTLSFEDEELQHPIENDLNDGDIIYVVSFDYESISYLDMFIHYFNKLHGTNYDNQISRLEDWEKYYRVLAKNEATLHSDSYIVPSVDALIDASYLESNEQIVNSYIDYVCQSNGFKQYCETHEIEYSNFNFYEAPYDKQIIAAAYIFSDQVVNSSSLTLDEDAKRLIALKYFWTLFDCNEFSPVLSSLHSDDYTRGNFITVYISDIQEKSFITNVYTQQYWNELCQNFDPLPVIENNYIHLNTLLPPEATQEDIRTIIPMIEEHLRSLPFRSPSYRGLIGNNIIHYVVTPDEVDRMSIVEIVDYLKSYEFWYKKSVGGDA